MVAAISKNTSVTVTLKLYGQSGHWGRVPPRSFTVFHVGFQPAVVDISTVSPGRQDDAFYAELLSSTPGPEPENAIACS